MILIDVNILLYSTNRHASQHTAIEEWLERQLNQASRVGLPWASLLGFLRLATNSRIVAHALTMPAAWKSGVALARMRAGLDTTAD